MTASLGRERWRSFTVGYGLSAVGQSMSTVPVLMLVHERTDSLTWLGDRRRRPPAPVPPRLPAGRRPWPTGCSVRRLFLGSLLSRSLLAVVLAAAVTSSPGPPH